MEQRKCQPHSPKSHTNIAFYDTLLTFVILLAAKMLPLLPPFLRLPSGANAPSVTTFDLFVSRIRDFSVQTLPKLAYRSPDAWSCDCSPMAHSSRLRFFRTSNATRTGVSG